MHTLWQPSTNMVKWSPSLHYTMEKSKWLIRLRGFRSCDAQTPSIPNKQTEIWQHKKIIQHADTTVSRYRPDTCGEAVYTTVLSYRPFLKLLQIFLLVPVTCTGLQWVLTSFLAIHYSGPVRGQDRKKIYSCRGR